LLGLTKQHGVSIFISQVSLLSPESQQILAKSEERAKTSVLKNMLLLFLIWLQFTITMVKAK